MPTETVYGLAADATSDAAVAAIYAAKERPAINPLISHILDVETAREHAIFGPEAEALARAFWPGPLTLVLPAASTCRISLLARAGLETVALRSPSHETARALIGAAGVPLAAPSANRSGAVSPTTAAHVVADLDGRVDWILDGGPCRHGLESTIVACLAGRPRLLRPGRSRARRSNRRSARRSISTRPTRTAPNAPGQLASHYAPKAELRLGVMEAASDEAALDFGGSLKGGRRARVSIFRLPETLSRLRPIYFPICAPWTLPARRGSRSRRSRAWAWRGDQRSAPSRGRASERSDMNMVRHQFRADPTRPWEMVRSCGACLRMASAEMSGDRSSES